MGVGTAGIKNEGHAGICIRSGIAVPQVSVNERRLDRPALRFQRSKEPGDHLVKQDRQQLIELGVRPMGSEFVGKGLSQTLGKKHLPAVFPSAILGQIAGAGGDVKAKLTVGRTTSPMQCCQAGGEFLRVWKLARHFLKLAEEEMCLGDGLVCTPRDRFGCEVGHQAMNGRHGLKLTTHHHPASFVGDDFDEIRLQRPIFQLNVDTSRIVTETDTMLCCRYDPAPVG